MRTVYVGTLSANFYLIKKAYKAYNGCIFVQLRFEVSHDNLEYIYTLSALFQDERQTLFIKPEQIPEDMDTATAINFMQHTVGLEKVFNMFKEDIFLMLEEVLEMDEYSQWRFILLPL